MANDPRNDSRAARSIEELLAASVSVFPDPAWPRSDVTRAFQASRTLEASRETTEGALDALRQARVRRRAGRRSALVWARIALASGAAAGMAFLLAGGRLW